MNERETIEARYDAMPPEIASRLRRSNDNPFSNRYAALRGEVAFARRMFRAARQAGKKGRWIPPERHMQYRADCRHWWHRYRKAQRSAAELRDLQARERLQRSILQL